MPRDAGFVRSEGARRAPYFDSGGPPRDGLCLRAVGPLLSGTVVLLRAVCRAGRRSAAGRGTPARRRFRMWRLPAAGIRRRRSRATRVRGSPARHVPRREWKACRDACWLGPSVAAGRAVALGGEAVAADGAGWAGGNAGPFGIPLRCIARLAREVGSFGSAVGSTGLVILSVIRAMGRGDAEGDDPLIIAGSRRDVAQLRSTGRPG